MIKYFSTFTGIGSIELALSEIIPNAKCVGYSEVDKNAIKIYKKHFLSHKNYGDINKIDIDKLPNFDFLFGGSPCQDLSMAKMGGKGLQGEKSILFYKFLEILLVKKPRYFLLENVNSMNKKNKNMISNFMGVEPILINARYLSPQDRKRLFWCNFKIKKLDSDIYNLSIKDVMNNCVSKDNKVRHICPSMLNKIKEGKLKILSLNDKSRTCMTRQNRCPNAGMIKDELGVRFFTTNEYEALQSLPNNYTKVDGVSKLQRQFCIGNAINVNVARYIILNLKRQIEKDNSK